MEWRFITLRRCLAWSTRSKNLYKLFLMYVVLWVTIHSRIMIHLLSTPLSSTTNNGGSFWNSFTGGGLGDRSISACLLVMDDNHLLSEWIAYHYHALQLHTLIIATDPLSRTTPHWILDRWKDRIDIVEWSDEDFMTPGEFQEAQAHVLSIFGPDETTRRLLQHRARQRLFYSQCLKTIKQTTNSWALLIDTDEYLQLNHQVVAEQTKAAIAKFRPPTKHPNKAGAVAELLFQNTESLSAWPASQTEVAKAEDPLGLLQSSPCVQIPRLRFGAQERSSLNSSSSLPMGFHGDDFMTQRWRFHASPTDHKTNKISKALIDLSRVNETDIVPVDTRTHLPIRRYCEQPRLHTKSWQSLLIVNHYLGSYQQYTYRDLDARSGLGGRDQGNSNERSIQKWNATIRNSVYDDAIVSWLPEFVKENSEEAQSLLAGVGQLEPKSWKPYFGDPNKQRCALCFFGLPRAYQTLVLPSIVRNLLIPNARHNCDIYVHFYEQYQEAKGRRNRGGKIDPHAIYLLQQAAIQVQEQYGPKHGRDVNRVPQVRFTFDTEEQFWDRRGDQLKRYHSELNADGKPAFYPYRAHTYVNASIDNIVKQWHSVEYAFKLMEMTAMQLQVSYSRVGMFRNDAMFLTPIDVAMLDTHQGVLDAHNRFVTVAPFGRSPVNDRMIYGPIEAVKIWSTQRFVKLEERARLAQDPGYEMHSERFLNASIFSAILETSTSSHDKVQVNMDKHCCFVRTRSDESALIGDCGVNGPGNGNTEDWGKVDKKALVENISQHNCTVYKMGSAIWTAVGCGEGMEYHDGRD